MKTDELKEALNALKDRYDLDGYLLLALENGKIEFIGNAELSSLMPALGAGLLKRFMK